MKYLFNINQYKYDKKKLIKNKLILLFIFCFILIFAHGCIKNDNNEIHSILFFITRTEHGGDTQIDVFRRYDYDENTIYYFVKWKYVNGDNTNEREHLIILNTSTLKSELYPINYLDDYPSIKQKWDELKDKNQFTDFSKAQIDKFVRIANEIRK